MTGVSVAGVGYALKKIGDILSERKTPIMGVMAAFIFAAQMVNFPVLGGTSGHLLGAALAVAILGMWPAIITLTSVVLVQALLFQDGGLEALGANVFNMGIFSCLITGAVLGVGRKIGRRAFYPSVAFAAWLSVVGASFFCALELALSRTIPLKVILTTMLAVHAVIGVFEGLITIIALRFITAVHPGLIMHAPPLAENAPAGGEQAAGPLSEGS